MCSRQDSRKSRTIIPKYSAIKNTIFLGLLLPLAVSLFVDIKTLRLKSSYEYLYGVQPSYQRQIPPMAFEMNEYTGCAEV